MARIGLLGKMSGRAVLEGIAHGRAPAIAYGLAMVSIKHSWADGGDLGEGLGAGDRLQVRIVEVVKHNDFVPCICKHDDRVAADEPCAASNQDCLGHVSGALTTKYVLTWHVRPHSPQNQKTSTSILKQRARLQRAGLEMALEDA